MSKHTNRAIEPKMTIERTEVPSVSDALETMDKSMAYLMSVIDRLANRLQPILEPERTELGISPPIADRIDDGKSDLVKMIQDEDASINDAAARLNTLIDRCQL